MTETLELVNLKTSKPKKRDDGSKPEHVPQEDPPNTSVNKEESEEETDQANRVPEFSEHESSILKGLEAEITDPGKTSGNITTVDDIFPAKIHLKQPEEIQQETLRKDNSQTDEELASIEK